VPIAAGNHYLVTGICDAHPEEVKRFESIGAIIGPQIIADTGCSAGKSGHHGRTVRNALVAWNGYDALHLPAWADDGLFYYITH
jgi:hypothetical protein